MSSNGHARLGVVVAAAAPLPQLLLWVMRERVLLPMVVVAVVMLLVLLAALAIAWRSKGRRSTPDVVARPPTATHAGWCGSCSMREQVRGTILLLPINRRPMWFCL
jgi:cation transporter-like permease